jgi:hypothetical protein
LAVAILVLGLAQLTAAQARDDGFLNYVRARQTAKSYDEARAICRSLLGPDGRVARYRKKSGIVDCTNR